MNNIVKLMNISFDYSVIEDETFSKFGSKLLQIVFDEPMGMIPFYNIQLTFLNPTPISLNLGIFNIVSSFTVFFSF